MPFGMSCVNIVELHPPQLAAGFQSHSEALNKKWRSFGGIGKHPAEGCTALSEVPNVGKLKAWIFLILKNRFFYFCRLLALLVLRCQAAH